VTVSEPEISVVIATYNRAGTLPRAVASVLAQGDANFELIIIDDASADGTTAYLNSLNDPRIVARRAQQNLGPSGARNFGLELTRAPVVAFLDSDDAYLAHRLSAPLAALRADASLVATLSSALKYDRGVPREARIPDLTFAPAAFEWVLTCDLIPVEATSITVRREAALSVGGFCNALRLTEDREFLIRLSKLGGGRLLPDMLWEKFWSDEGLSAEWNKAAAGLVAYVRQRPEYLSRYPKLASYLGTKILVGHIRDRHYSVLHRDFNFLHGAGIVSANVLREIASHREVKRYRRAMSGAAALAEIRGPPQSWR
jgi:glycosyltransferase involved in cell wall biosynthesis